MSDDHDIRRERVRAAAIEVRMGVSQKLGSIWWSFLLRGLFALFWPGLRLSARSPLEVQHLC